MRRALLWAGAGLVLIFLISGRQAVTGGLQHAFGFGPGGGNTPQYLFWSGIAGIIERLIELAAIGAILYWHHNCSRHGCWGYGKYDFTNPDTGITRKLCWKCHPDVHHKHLTDELIGHIHHRQREEASR
jgi:hypothetical protein